MAVDLADLIESLQRETSPPGTDLFPTATDDEWLGQLQDAFWAAKLHGFDAFDNYTEQDGLVFPISGDDELGREWQQLLVLFAGIRSIRMKLMNTNTSFRAQAGPVEFETANSANLLNEILRELQKQVDRLYDSLGDLGDSSTYYINGMISRSASIGYQDEYFWW